MLRFGGTCNPGMFLVLFKDVENVVGLLLLLGHTGHPRGGNGQKVAPPALAIVAPTSKATGLVLPLCVGLQVLFAIVAPEVELVDTPDVGRHVESALGFMLVHRLKGDLLVVDRSDKLALAG